ncbi:MAG: amidohydrolase family protein, partial [Actinomycetia bacterium]|nr:amidohydrolase family protein [Actinomycetes bacterium]
GAVRNREGRLAGSALTMNQAVRNMVAFTDCAPDEALRAASTTPSRAVGVENKGAIEVGGDADLVLLDPTLAVVATLCRGQVAYLDDSARGRWDGDVETGS